MLSSLVPSWGFFPDLFPPQKTYQSELMSPVPWSLLLGTHPSLCVHVSTSLCACGDTMCPENLCLCICVKSQHRSLYPDFKIKMSHMLQLVTPTLLVLLEIYTTICILNYSFTNKTDDNLSSISEKIPLSIKWNRVCESVPFFPPHDRIWGRYYLLFLCALHYFFIFNMASGKRNPFFRVKDYLFSTTKTLIVPIQFFISSNF